MTTRDPRNPYGDQRRLNPAQRAMARNVRHGIEIVDRLNAGLALAIGHAIRALPPGPINEAGYQLLMADVDRHLDALYGATKDRTLESPMGVTILNQCVATGLEVHVVEAEKNARRQTSALRRRPAVAQALMRKHGIS